MFFTREECKKERGREGGIFPCVVWTIAADDAKKKMSNGATPWKRPAVSAATMTTQCRREHRRLPDRCSVYVMLCDRYAYPCFKYYVECRRAELLNDLAFWRTCLSYVQDPTCVPSFPSPTLSPSSPLFFCVSPVFLKKHAFTF